MGNKAELATCGNQPEQWWNMHGSMCGNNEKELDTLTDGAQRLRGSDIPAWVPTIQAVESHITGWFDALEGGKGRSDLDRMVKSIVAPTWWASPCDQGRWNSCRQTTAEPDMLSPESALGLAKYGYLGYISKRKTWSVMEVPETRQSIAVADIPEASFLGVVPGILRCSSIFKEGCVPGPDGLWLDTRESEGSLSKIALGAKEDTNTVLAWHFTGDCGASGFQTAWLLAFSCRPVEMFQELVRWEGGNPKLVKVKEERDE